MAASGYRLAAACSVSLWTMRAFAYRPRSTTFWPQYPWPWTRSTNPWSSRMLITSSTPSLSSRVVLVTPATFARSIR